MKLGKEGERTKRQKWLNSTCWLISVSRNAIIIIASTVIAYYLYDPEQTNFPFSLTGSTYRSPFIALNCNNFGYSTGKIPSGFPPFKAPPFSFQSGDKTYTFTEICSNLGSSLYVAPLVAIIEPIAVTKSLGNIIKLNAVLSNTHYVIKW